jgi:hypothetical protein
MNKYYITGLIGCSQPLSFISIHPFQQPACNKALTHGRHTEGRISQWRGDLERKEMRKERERRRKGIGRRYGTDRPVGTTRQSSKEEQHYYLYYEHVLHSLFTSLPSSTAVGEVSEYICYDGCEQRERAI